MAVADSGEGDHTLLPDAPAAYKVFQGGDRISCGIGGGIQGGV